MENKWHEEYKYREMMERECFSKEEKENMIRKLMQSSINQATDVDGASAGRVTSKGNTRRSDRNFLLGKPRVKGVVAACLIVCLFITGVAGVSAAGLLKPASDVFKKVFRLTDYDKEMADRVGQSLGESVVSNGVRVTADAVIADSYAYAVVFSVEREDGKPLDGGQKLGADNWDFTTSDIRPLGWGSFYSYDESPEDSAIQYVMISYDHRKIRARDHISVHLSDFCHYAKGYNKDYTVKGEWRMELPFPESLDEFVVKGETLELDGNLFTIENISISPISEHLIFSIKKDSELDLTYCGRLLENCVMELELKDGERIVLGKGGSGVVSKSDRIQYVYGDNFDSLLHLEDVKSIHIGKLEFPVQVK